MRRCGALFVFTLYYTVFCFAQQERPVGISLLSVPRFRFYFPFSPFQITFHSTLITGFTLFIIAFIVLRSPSPSLLL
uniref:Putative secreted peptide n=1 Tax=Anopheles braziliensis TaxID=58242 RepID=A0A2M3ZP53_9DIPT